MLTNVEAAGGARDRVPVIPRDGGLREQRRQQTRSRILQAALETFAERGYEGAAIRDIAARAGVNHALIKYHFVDKETLWKTAVAFLFDRLDRDVRFYSSTDRDTSDLDRLKDWIRRYVRYCARHPEHARIMMQVSMSDGPRLAWAARFIRSEHEDAAAWIAKYARRGIWPDVAPHSLIYILVTACQMVFALAAEVRHVHGVDMMADDAIDAHAEAIITLFFEHKAADRDGA